MINSKFKNAFSPLENHIIKNKWFYIVLALVALPRLFYLIISDNFYYGGDIFSRVYAAYFMSQGSLWYASVDWPPGQFWILDLIYSTTGNTETLLRLPGIMADIGSCLIIFLISKRLFNERVALFCSILYGTYFLSILFSTVTLVGPLNNFFLLLSLFALLNYSDVKKLGWLFIASLSLLYGNLLRTESWGISFLLGLVLLIQYFKDDFKSNFKRIFHIFLYAILTASPIIIWLYINYRDTGNALWIIDYSDLEVSSAVAKYHPDNFEVEYDWLLRVFMGIPTLLLVGSPVLIAYFAFKSDKRNYFIPFYVLFGLQLVKLLNKTLMNDPRYLAITFIILTISAGGCLYYYFPKKHLNKALIYAFLLIQIGNLNHYSFYKDKEKSGIFHTFPRAFLEMSEFIRTNDFAKNKIYLDVGYQTLHLALFYKSGLHNEQIVCETPLEHWLDKEFSTKFFDECIDLRNVDTLFTFPTDLFPAKTLAKYLKTTEGQDHIKSKGFQAIFNRDGYAIYTKKD